MAHHGDLVAISPPDREPRAEGRQTRVDTGRAHRRTRPSERASYFGDCSEDDGGLGRSNSRSTSFVWCCGALIPPGPWPRRYSFCHPSCAASESLTLSSLLNCVRLADHFLNASASSGASV